MTFICRAELAALVDLGMSDERIATYLGIGLADLRSRYQLRQNQGHARRGPSAAGRQRAEDPSIKAMRDEARALLLQSKSNSAPAQRTKAAIRAFELAQLAECRERRLADITTPPEPERSAAQASATDAAAVLLDAARRWRMRAEEYWTVYESIRTPVARETYSHLARSYERLAEQFEARARGKKPSGRGQTG